MHIPYSKGNDAFHSDKMTRLHFALFLRTTTRAINVSSPSCSRLSGR